jgi:hypothetical protein
MSFYFMTMSIALLGKMRKHRFRMTRSHVQSHPDTKGQILAVTLRADTKVVVFSQQTLLSLSLSLSLSLTGSSILSREVFQGMLPERRERKKESCGGGGGRGKSGT